MRAAGVLQSFVTDLRESLEHFMLLEGIEGVDEVNDRMYLLATRRGKAAIHDLAQTLVIESLTKEFEMDQDMNLEDVLKAGAYPWPEEEVLEAIDFRVERSRVRIEFDSEPFESRRCLGPDDLPKALDSEGMRFVTDAEFLFMIHHSPKAWLNKVMAPYGEAVITNGKLLFTAREYEGKAFTSLELLDIDTLQNGYKQFDPPDATYALVRQSSQWW